MNDSLDEYRTVCHQFGTKRCKLDIKIKGVCSLSTKCPDEFIRKRTEHGISLANLLIEVRDVWPAASDYIILRHIARVVGPDRYGEKEVRAAIRVAELNSSYEKIDVRRAYEGNLDEGLIGFAPERRPRGLATKCATGAFFDVSEAVEA